MAGKDLNDLNLSDHLIGPTSTRTASAADVRSERWYQLLQEIDDLLASGQANWAAQTLEGIRETVEQRKVVTEGQERAVRNIAERVESSRSRPRTGSRRYEGYSR